MEGDPATPSPGQPQLGSVEGDFSGQRLPWHRHQNSSHSARLLHCKAAPSLLRGLLTWASPAGSLFNAQDGWEIPLRQLMWRLNESTSSGVGRLCLKILNSSLSSAH